jgi:hypothetical protein
MRRQRNGITSRVQSESIHDHVMTGCGKGSLFGMLVPNDTPCIVGLWLYTFEPGKYNLHGPGGRSNTRNLVRTQGNPTMDSPESKVGELECRR